MLIKQSFFITVKPPPTATSPQQPPLYKSEFFGGQSIHSLLFQPLYNGYLSKMATSFCPQDGRCKEVQLYVKL